MTRGKTAAIAAYVILTDGASYSLLQKKPEGFSWGAGMFLLTFSECTVLWYPCQNPSWVPASPLGLLTSQLLVPLSTWIVEAAREGQKPRVVESDYFGALQ